MKETPEQMAEIPSPVSSPHPTLQALLPRLGSIGTNTDNRPVFEEPPEVEAYLQKHEDNADDFHVVPVWAINHKDLTSSEVVNWTYRRWLN